MASTISDIISESLEKIKIKHLSLTPENYSKIFCEVAKSNGVMSEDCSKVTKYINKLDPKLATEAKKVNVSTIDELLAFFVSRLNKSNEGERQQLITSLVTLSKRTLQTISLLHNKKAATLANASLERLDLKPNLQSIELIKDTWFDFLSSYDDSFLENLDIYGKIDKEDLEKMVDDIIRLLGKDDDTEIYKALSPLIVATLAPSIASSMNDDLATISYELRNSPESLSSQAMQKEIKYFIKKRVELDKEEVRKKISLLNKILAEINKKILTLIDASDMSNEQVKGTKQDIKNINFTEDSFESIENRLIHISNSLETQTECLRSKMSENQKTINNLRIKVKKLENSLLIAKKESKEDFLTKIATKDVLIDELKRAEEAYTRYKIDYTVCFLDIDHFKVINGTYGHDAGDVILATFGKIFTHYVRQVDFAGRYGGEKFLVILPGIDLAQGLDFAEKMRAIIENYKFIYKNERITVAISCGVAQRGQSKSDEDTVIDADKMLDKAKEFGRNQVMPKH